MPSDLRTVLDDAAGATDPLAPLDVDAIVRTGRRRRTRARVAQATSGLAVLVVLAVAGAQVLTDVANPPLLLDSPPQPGLGTWEPVGDAPLEPVEQATAIDLGDGTVLVVGGTAQRPDTGQAHPAGAARYDLGTGTWTALDPVPFADDRTVEVRALPIDGGALVYGDTFQDPGPFEAAILDAGSGTWQRSGRAPIAPRTDPVVEWIDGRLVVWGGRDVTRPEPSTDMPRDAEDALLRDRETAEAVVDGAVWTPGEGWAPMADFPLEARFDAGAGVAGGELVVWGGTDAVVDDPDRRLFADGARYDVDANTWTVLPDAGLSAREQAGILGDDEGFFLAGGTGEVTITERRTETTAEEPTCVDGVCTDIGTTAFGREFDYEWPRDGARFDLASGTWQPLPELPEGADGYEIWDDLIATEAFHRWDAGADRWVPLASAPTTGEVHDVELGGVRHAVRAVGFAEAHRRLGGWVTGDDGRWAVMAEAETAARGGAAVTAVGDDAIFVWGGTSRLPGADPDDLSAESSVHHLDGAVWRP
jgi:hypothetical protein